MGALGLSTYRQFALGAIQYGTGTNEGLTALDWQPGEPIAITHVVPNSVSHPQMFMGRGPATLSGTMQLQAMNLLGFLTVLNTATERHASWVWHNGTEVYVHVCAAQATVERFTTNFGAPATDKLVKVYFEFRCGDQRLYKASDDSVLLGA